MNGSKLLVVGLSMSLMFGLANGTVWAVGKIAQDPEVAALIQKGQALQAQLDIITTQWYDIYEKGMVANAPEAGKQIQQALQVLATGDKQQADTLLDSASQLLSQYTAASIPDYTAPAPMAAPADLGKVRKATMEDLASMVQFDVPRWNYWYNFVGKGDDGNLYMAYAYVNHHGTGKIVPPTVFAMSCSKDPATITKVNFTNTPTFTQTADQLVYAVQQGDQSLSYTLTDGKISIQYKDANKSIESSVITKYSFWYNKGTDYALILPGAPMAGFEETGAATATFVLDGQTINATGFGESENLFCGGPKGADYRSALIKYGNEWWVPFWTAEAEGIFVMTGNYKDAGLHINGQYIIPSEFHVTPIVANTSFIIDAKTSAGDLSLTFNMWGWDPPLYEHWGTVTGSLDGKPLTSGYCWLEHIPQGGVNASPPSGVKK